MGGEDGRDGDRGAADLGNGRTAHPLVEVGDDRAARRLGAGHGAEELLHRPAECHDLVDQVVVGREGNAVVFPEQVLDLGQPREDGARVHQHGARPAGDQPVPVVDLNAHFAHRRQHITEDARGLGLLELRRRDLRVVGADQAVTVAPLVDHRRHLGADDGVDAAHLLAHFPGHFEQQGLGPRVLRVNVAVFGRRYDHGRSPACPCGAA